MAFWFRRHWLADPGVVYDGLCLIIESLIITFLDKPHQPKLNSLISCWRCEIDSSRSIPGNCAQVQGRPLLSSSGIFSQWGDCNSMQYHAIPGSKPSCFIWSKVEHVRIFGLLTYSPHAFRQVLVPIIVVPGCKVPAEPFASLDCHWPCTEEASWTYISQWCQSLSSQVAKCRRSLLPPWIATDRARRKQVEHIYLCKPDPDYIYIYISSSSTDISSMAIS